MAYDTTHAKYMPARHCCSCGSNGRCNLCHFPHEEHTKCKGAEHGEHSDDCKTAYHSASLTLERIDAEKLEKMLDTYGLKNVLETLSSICHAKSQHIAENWQDGPESLSWASDAKRLERFRVHVDQRGYVRKLEEVR